VCREPAVSESVSGESFAPGAGRREGAVNPSLGATFALRRSRILLRLQGRCWPSMANPFGGIRLTHGKGPSL